MAEPPELWTFALVNLFVFAFGAVLTGLSYYSYRASDRRPSIRTSTLGFAVLTVGGAVEPVYQLGIRGDYHLIGRELLALQSIEGLCVAIGLGLLFYSIYIHDARPRREHLEELEFAPDTR